MSRPQDSLMKLMKSVHACKSKFNQLDDKTY